MPNTKSALKRLRQNQERRLRNRRFKSITKTTMKKYLTLLENGKIEEAKTLLPEVTKKVDMAASKGVFHPNKASRLKSRLAQRLNSHTEAVSPQ